MMAAGSDAVVASVEPPADVTPGRILVVDDTEMNRDLLVRRLERQGHVVVTATNGREAVERLKSEPFDVMLLDIMMPEMDGYQVLEKLQTEDSLQAVRVIMISAVDELDSVVRCLKLGADDYLTKPFNATLLRARLESSLARKRLRDREHDYARSLERELEIGREIQAQFLPEALPAAPGWELAALLRPARQVSGDFYDAFPVGSTGAIGTVVADVCDKGVGAALFMALYRTLLRAGAEGGEFEGAASLQRSLSLANDYIARVHGRSNMFATLFFAVLDPGTGELTYANGGHEPPILRRATGGVDRLAPTGPAVGLLPGVEFGTERVTVERGDALVVFTDGVTEARSADGSLYEEGRLLTLLDGLQGSAEELLAGIDADVERHATGAGQSDDVTLLVVRRHP